MKDKAYFGSVLHNPKYKGRAKEIGGAYQGTVESGAHSDKLTKFNASQGQGFAAEQANHLLDTIQGRDALILGDDNAKNGADRMVNNQLIQTKYCQTAAASVDAAFANGKYRYLDANGKPMQLEVPSDQYADAIKYMRRRIENGQVPGVKDPNYAEKLVRKGNVDYQTACRIAKAGTIDSLLFDAANGTVIAASAMGISSIITFAKAIWNGESIDKAMDVAVYMGLKSGGIVFAASVLTAQLTRTGLNNLMLAPSVEIVRLLPSGVRHTLVNSLREGSVIYGGAATNNLAKIMRGNIIAAGAVMLVMSAGDITDFFRGRISAKQLMKNIMTVAAGVGGGYAGAAAGAAVGTLILPGIGTKIGAVAGGIVGGSLAGEGANSLLSNFVESDAEAMLEILNRRLVPLVQEYMLSEEELEIVVDDLNYELVHEKMLQMFGSDDKEAFADALLTKVIENVIRWRVHITTPSMENFTKSLGRVLEMSQDEAKLQAYFMQKKVDTKAISKELLGRKVSERASKKAWYVTKQMNFLNMQQEYSLHRMKDGETAFKQKNEQDKKELSEYRRELVELLGE